MAVTKTGGHLALTPEVMRKLAPADQLEFAPAYFQGQFRRVQDRLGRVRLLRRLHAPEHTYAGHDYQQQL